MQDEFVTCRNCGHDVPKTIYCIYCGAKLAEGKKEHKPEPDEMKPQEQEIKPVMSEPIKEISDEKFFQIPAYSYDTQADIPSDKDGELDAEKIHTTDEPRKYHLWKVKLCGLLANQAVSEEVFTKIYEDYDKKINQFREIRDNEIKKVTEQYEEKIVELEKFKFEHDELNARVAVGEIPDTELIIRKPELTKRINSLTRETSKLEADISRIKNLMRGMHSKEVFKLEKQIRSIIYSLDSLVAREKLSEEFSSKLLEYLKGTLEMLDDSTSEWKGEEKELRNEIETLEVRYKIGEITLEQYETEKQKLFTKLEQLWA